MNHNQKLPCVSGGATMIRSFVRGGHETGREGA